MNLERLQGIEMIDPTRLPPWRQETFSLMEIQPGREMAVEKAEAVWSTSDIVQNKLPFRLCDQRYQIFCKSPCLVSYRQFVRLANSETNVQIQVIRRMSPLH
jgi:hypothetical protein